MFLWLLFNRSWLTFHLPLNITWWDGSRFPGALMWWCVYDFCWVGAWKASSSLPTNTLFGFWPSLSFPFCLWITVGIRSTRRVASNAVSRSPMLLGHIASFSLHLPSFSAWHFRIALNRERPLNKKSQTCLSELSQSIDRGKKLKCSHSILHTRCSTNTRN